MARPLAIIQEAIRSLGVGDKGEILRTLFEELDGPPDHNVEAAWLAEAQRRGEEIDSSAVKCIPAKDVFDELAALLKK